MVDGRRDLDSVEASPEAASRGDLLQRSTILTSCSGDANDHVAADDAQSGVRMDMIAAERSMVDRRVVVDRGSVNRLVQTAQRMDKVVGDVLAVVVAGAVGAAAVVSRMAGNRDDRKAKLRFVDMGRARVVAVVWDPLSR
jgi:hypothetical protein